MADTIVKPKATLRRFDMFAEYNRRRADQEGQPVARAKGHAQWLAQQGAAPRAFEGGEPDKSIRLCPPAPWKLGAKQGLGG